jgi:hypothetical protein
MASSKSTCGAGLLLLIAAPLFPQSPDPAVAKILQRLDQLEQTNQRLEQENQQLKQDLASVRKEILDLQAAKSGPPVDEKLDVQQQRIEDLAQSKVEAAQKFPVKLSGLVLMNTFLYAGHTGGEDLPVVGRLSAPITNAGGTFRNSEIAFSYSGPHNILGGEFAGRLQIDFFGGTLNTQNQLARIRTADVSMHWANRSLAFAIDKPIFSPREPDSIAQLGISPLANAGNLWLWQPQLRYEERVQFSPQTGLRARLGIYQTNETLTAVPANVTLSRSRPAAQGRFEVFHELKDNRRIEVAAGFHRSESHAGGVGVGSYAVSADWLAPIAPHLDWTGFIFTGENLAGLGIAGIRQGITFRQNGPIPVHSKGGWTQATIAFSDRVKFHLLAGLQDDRDRDLAADGVSRNFAYGANLHIRLAPNVIFGPELLQIRTRYRQSGERLINRYDLAIGYLF